MLAEVRVALAWTAQPCRRGSTLCTDKGYAMRIVRIAIAALVVAATMEVWFVIHQSSVRVRMPRPVLDVEAFAYAVSPDGSRVAYPDSSGWHVQRFGSRRSALLAASMPLASRRGDATPTVLSAAWSPDSRRIALVTALQDRRCVLTVVDPSTGYRLAVDSAGYIGSPAWSSDGKMLAWFGQTDRLNPGQESYLKGYTLADTHVYQFRVSEVGRTGAGASRIVYSGEKSPLRWAPGSRSLVLDQPAKGVGIVDTGTGAVRWIMAGRPEFHIGRGRVAMWDISPDGRHIGVVCCAGVWRCELAPGLRPTKLAGYLPDEPFLGIPGGLLWSRDGRGLYYISTEPYHAHEDDCDSMVVRRYQYGVRWVSADGSRRRTLLDGLVWASSLQTSDGGQVFYAAPSSVALHNRLYRLEDSAGHR